MWARILMILAATSLAAQQIDSGGFDRSGRGGSWLDRADTDAERHDFDRLQKTSGATERRALCDSFVARYPRSWLLANVYQIATGASLELKDYGRALTDGRASLRLLPENAVLLVALAQIEMARGQPAQAGRDARDALLWLSVLAPPAGGKPSEWNTTRRALEDAAHLVLKRLGRPQPAAEPAGKEPGRDKGQLAGSSACKACHEVTYAAWLATGMSAMLRPVEEAALLANFSQVHEFRDDDGKIKVRTGGGDRPYFEFAVSGGLWKRFRVDYAIGSKWQQAYATRLADERLHVFPIQYSALEKRWLNYWSTIDPPGSERAQIDQFPRLSMGTSYQRNCAVCHTSQLRLLRLDDATMQHASFREPGINCEMCHGPSAQHVAAMRSGKSDLADPADPPFRFSRMDHREATLICGQCHRQSALRDLGPRGEMNYTAEPPYFNRLTSQPYAEFGVRAFYRDGRFRETTFIGEAFLRSACFRRGTAQCASCHNPHPADARSNPASLKFLANPDQMCLQCHTSIGARIRAHTRHAAGSTGSRCAACHMPPIMNSLLFRAASHQIDDIPRADLTARFGQTESPNACLLCHKDKEIEWVAGQLRGWLAVY